MDVIKSGNGEWCNKMGNKFFIFFLDFLVIMRNTCFSSVIVDLAKFKSGINSWWGKKANQNWQNFCTFQILAHQTNMLWPKFHELRYTSITNPSTFSSCWSFAFWLTLALFAPASILATEGEFLVEPDPEYASQTLELKRRSNWFQSKEEGPDGRGKSCHPSPK